MVIKNFKADKNKENINEALSIYINDIAYKMANKEEKIIMLSLGEAFFEIPRFPFENLDFNKGYHYSESLGLLKLREKIAEYYLEKNIKVDPERDILITCGSKIAIYMVMQMVLEKDDEVLIHEPAWLSYPEQVKLAGGKTVFIPCDYKISDIEQFINQNTRLVILNNPNNPAGKIYTSEELQKVYKICYDRGIYLMVDEAYSEFVVDDSFMSILEISRDKKGVILVNSFSKNFGMSGWRIGYVIANEKFISELLKLNQHLITCAPTILQMYMAEYFDEISQITFEQARNVVNKRNEVQGIADELGLSYLKGSATFYMFINIGNYEYSSLDLALYLIFKYGIAVVPGEAYGVTTERFIRISVGVEKLETIKYALEQIKSVIENQEFNKDIIRERMNEFDLKEFS